MGFVFFGVLCPCLKATRLDWHQRSLSRPHAEGHFEDHWEPQDFIVGLLGLGKTSSCPQNGLSMASLPPDPFSRILKPLGGFLVCRLRFSLRYILYFWLVWSVVVSAFAAMLFVSFVEVPLQFRTWFQFWFWLLVCSLSWNLFACAGTSQLLSDFVVEGGARCSKGVGWSLLWPWCVLKSPCLKTPPPESWWWRFRCYSLLFAYFWFGVSPVGWQTSPSVVFLFVGVWSTAGNPSETLSISSSSSLMTGPDSSAAILISLLHGFCFPAFWVSECCYCCCSCCAEPAAVAGFLRDWQAAAADAAAAGAESQVLEDCSFCSGSKESKPPGATTASAALILDQRQLTSSCKRCFNNTEAANLGS